MKKLNENPLDSKDKKVQEAAKKMKIKLEELVSILLAPVAIKDSNIKCLCGKYHPILKNKTTGKKYVKCLEYGVMESSHTVTKLIDKWLMSQITLLSLMKFEQKCFSSEKWITMELNKINRRDLLTKHKVDTVFSRSYMGKVGCRCELVTLDDGTPKVTFSMSEEYLKNKGEKHE